MDVFTECICLEGRKNVDCQQHQCTQIREILDTPIWIELAWEMDLNWEGSAGELFWQHGRLSLWGLSADSETEQG